jgi:fatty acid desaturase
VLQWFTGNIGFHHIHHLESRIPNYNLPSCYDAVPELRQAVTFGFWDSLKCAKLKLWDERRGRMVSFAEVPEVKTSILDGQSRPQIEADFTARRIDPRVGMTLFLNILTSEPLHRRRKAP